MVVSEVNITPVKPTDGLVAFASCLLNEQLFIGSLGENDQILGCSGSDHFDCIPLACWKTGVLLVRVQIDSWASPIGASNSQRA